MVDVIQEMPLEGVAPSRKILRMALDAALLDENLTEALLLVSEMQTHSCRVSVGLSKPYSVCALPIACQHCLISILHSLKHNSSINI